MRNNLCFKLVTVFTLFTLLFSGVLCAQDFTEIIDKYRDYTDAPREVAYVHLNKSTYIKGESIGFTAYVIDKKSKKPSVFTTNLYINISDENKTIIKQKLIKVSNGIASNVIEIDSLFSSGAYTFKAYTNWMRNFNEQNYYSETFNVIDPSSDQYINRELVSNDIDAQFLPESGHLLNGIVNNVGVVVKDSQGFGLAFTEGEVLDKNNEVLTTFKTNKLGIGRFQLLAELNNFYTIKINHANEDFKFPLGHSVKKNGIILTVNHQKAKLYASVVTNKETLKLLQSKNHFLMVHNGNDYEVMEIDFNGSATITKALEYDNIPSGTNILTLFDQNNKPVAERLFFNYKGINIVTSDKVTVLQKDDSLSLKLSYKEIDPERFNNMSVSILPSETLSYNRHHNILSQTFLRPYLKGLIEQGNYYFKNVDDRKKIELDNLLITQGWSSYDWNNMFLPEKMPYPFEQGILLKANINNPDKLKDVYILHHFEDSQPQYKQTSEGKNTIVFERIFPYEENQILISRLEKNEKMYPAQVYVQPIPFAIPQLNSYKKTLKPKSTYKISENLKRVSPFSVNLKKVQELDEVLVKAELNNNKTRTQIVSRSVFGEVREVKDMDKLTYLFLEDFLLRYRVQSFYDVESGNMIFTGGRPAGSLFGGGPMRVFLDDVPLINTGFLYRYPIAYVDYVEINRDGIGEGARGGNGTLRIYTDIESMFRGREDETTQTLKLPLTFSANKKYYVPKYKNYNDSFYQGYGTIDWKPKLSVDSKGQISFKIEKPFLPIKLQIEGITNDGTFIVEEKPISLN